MSVYVYELDAEITDEVELNESLSKQNSISFGAKIGGKYELNFDFNAPTSTVTHKYTVKKGSDKLGDIVVYYNDYIIKSETTDKYELNYYNSSLIL